MNWRLKHFLQIIGSNWQKMAVINLINKFFVFDFCLNNSERLGERQKFFVCACSKSVVDTEFSSSCDGES